MSKGRSGDKAGDSKPDAKQRLKDMDPIERNWRILTLLIEKAKKNYKNLNLPQDNLSRFSLKIFREDPEYGSKIAYMLYLKRAYRFFMIPLEERPGLLSRIFYADASSKWKPSHEEAKDLLEKFYLETKLIKKLPDRNWYKIKKSKDPEVVLNNILYGIEFKPDFEGFLRNIPWIVSKDRYGAPALDLVLWNPPGTEVPQKPVGVDDEFIDKLVAGVREHESYARIEVDDEFVELKNRKQIEKRLEEDERVLIDSYVGVSKIERDFVLHKRLILWRNPGFERWEEESKMGKIRSSKPEPYLALLQEKATQLEIPFIAHEKTTKKK